MSFLNKIRDQHNQVYRVFLVLITVGIIVYFFPKEAAFKYDFQRNQPWLYEDLIAPYDIPVYKTDGEIEQEKQRLKEAKKVYFSFDQQKVVVKKALFEKSLKAAWPNFLKTHSSLLGYLKSKEKRDFESQVLYEKYNKAGQSILDKIYNRGVVELVKEINALGDSAKFYVNRNNYYAAYSISDVFTAKSAYEFAGQELAKIKDLDRKFLTDLLGGILDKDAVNITFNKSETNRILEEELGKVDLVESVIKKGFSLISQGERIDDHKFKLLKSFERKYKSRQLSTTNVTTIGIGQTILVAVLMTCLMLYLMFFRSAFLDRNQNLVFMLFIIALFVVLTTLVLTNDLFHLYIMPIALAPIVVRSFFDTRTAFFVHLIIVLLLGFIVPNGFHFIFLQLVAGMMGIYGFSNFRNRSQLFYTALIIALSYTVSYIALNIIVEGDFEKIDWKTVGFLTISSLLTLLAYPVIYLFEKLFGFMSDVTLLELADTNNKLLRELSRKAPGTFQHSLQVANLAEAATDKIGGNSLLIRTAALYHDIGKMEAPMYFIENQSTGINPHNELSHEESAQIIINHVHDGIRIAKENGIPDLIIDFIRTHHGTTKTGYFYKLYMMENPGDEDAESLFTYPGPIPYSKETAVLMMADSVEAASRSLKEPDAKNIEGLVDSIITRQMEEGQFENADITLKDIRVIKKMFKKMLMNIYHVRIEYPH